MSILLLLAGCGCLPSTWFTLPSEQGPHTGPLVPDAHLKLRERRLILPGVSNIPPPPEPAVSSSQCGDMRDGGPVDGGGCVTSEIRCGETVIGHTRGGVRQFDTDWWESNFCWPATYDHDGGDERIYRLEMPQGEWRAFVWLDSPCADLDLMAFKWDDTDCPPKGANVTHCECNRDSGARNEKVELVHQGNATWFVVVEGVDDEEGAFALHVQCREGLQ
jgi:hypothetical protein